MNNRIKFLGLLLMCSNLLHSQALWDYAGMISQSFSGDYFWKLGSRETVNGKEYTKVLYIPLFFGVKAQEPGWTDLWNDVNDDDALAFLVREENGQILGLKEGYSAFCQGYFSLDSVYMCEAEDSTEFILYDFTLEKGTRYPHKDEVFVDSVASIVTLDGQQRRYLRLSNGIELIEGIGVINAMGTYGFYQQFSFPDEMQCKLMEFYIDGQLVYTPDVLTGLHNVPSSLNSKHSSLNRFDLSGRRLTVPSTSSVRSVLPKGVYIEDGKKKVKK